MSEARAKWERDSNAEWAPAPDRSRDLLGRRDSKIRKHLVKVWESVKRGFEDQAERADRQMDYWDAYNCVLNQEQFYDGDAQIFIPIIRDAINARATRFVNQLFPQGGSYVEAVDGSGNVPAGIVGLLDQYIRDGKLKTKVAKPLCKMGDIEGQYNLYVDWTEIERQIVSRETHGPVVKIADEETEVPGEDMDDVATEDILDARPALEVTHDSDILVSPASADSIDEALAGGGLVAIVRRWSKAKLEKMIEAGHVSLPENADEESLLDQMTAGGKTAQGTPPNIEKTLAEMVGVRKQGSEATIWEVWKMLPLNDKGDYDEKKGTDRLCRIYFGPDQTALGCVRNPHWNDRCPLLSEPVEKVAGVFKGKSQVEPVISLQYEANDAANEGADTAHYAALPIILRDPTKAGKQPLVMNIAAIWDVPPDSVKFAEFPDLTPRAVTRIQYCIAQVFQSLGVNPSMLPQQTSQSKRNQAQIAQEQAVDLLTVAENVDGLAEVFTWAMQWFVDLDYQFRERELTVQLHGTQGVRANMEAIPPQLTREAYTFRWWGADQARNAAQYQQQIAWMNVARGLEPMLKARGYALDFVPVLESSAMSLFGPRYGPLIIKDERSNMSLDPEMENQIMSMGHIVPVQMLDQDQQHIQSHMQDLQLNGDPHLNKALHIGAHMRQMAGKQQAMMLAQMAQGMQGQSPKGQNARPSRGGAPPRMGAQARGPQQLKGPPGMINPDQMPRAGGTQMPRQM